jgi:hypothetical protein
MSQNYNIEGTNFANSTLYVEDNESTLCIEDINNQDDILCIEDIDVQNDTLYINDVNVEENSNTIKKLYA